MTKVLQLLLVLSITLAPAAQAEEMLGQGADASFPLIRSLAEAFRAQSRIALTVQAGGGERGLQAIERGAADFAFLSRPLTDEEQAAGLVATTYAYEAAAVVVNPRNAREDITVAELREMYRGRIRQWEDGSELTVAHLKNRASLRSLFMQRVLHDAGEPDEEIVEVTQNAIAGAIAKRSHALGYMPFGLVPRSKVKVLSVNGVSPARDAVRSGEYPLARPLTLVTKGAHQPPVKDFITFALSERGKAVIEAEGFVSSASVEAQTK